MTPALSRDLFARMAARAAFHRRVAHEYTRDGSDAMTDAMRTLIADHEALEAQWRRLSWLLGDGPDRC